MNKLKALTTVIMNSINTLHSTTGVPPQATRCALEEIKKRLEELITTLPECEEE